MTGVRYGAGKHAIIAGFANVVRIAQVSFLYKLYLFNSVLTSLIPLQITFALQITYNLAHLAIKSSILLLYRSIFTLNNRRFRIAYYFILLYIIAWSVMSICLTLTECLPISYSWFRIYGAKGKCFNLKGRALGAAVMNTISDVALLILPMPLLWKLQMPVRRKLQLFGIFLLGGLSVLYSSSRS